jgi:hypothetical protein
MKKAINLITFLSLLPIFLFAQNDFIRFGISLNPNYSYRFFYSKNSNLKITFDNIDVGKFSYSIGAFCEKQFNDKIRLRVGLNAMNTGIGTRKKQDNGFVVIGGSFPTSTPSTGSAFRLVFNDVKIELPIDFHFFINKKQSFYIDFGLSPTYNIYSYSTFKRYSSDGSIKNINSTNIDPEAKKLQFASQVGIGYEFPLNKKIKMDIQPRFQYFLTGFAHHANSLGFFVPYNLGLQMGAKF